MTVSAVATDIWNILCDPAVLGVIIGFWLGVFAVISLSLTCLCGYTILRRFCDGWNRVFRTVEGVQKDVRHLYCAVSSLERSERRQVPSQEPPAPNWSRIIVSLCHTAWALVRCFDGVGKKSSERPATERPPTTEDQRLSKLEDMLNGVAETVSNLQSLNSVEVKPRDVVAVADSPAEAAKPVQLSEVAPSENQKSEWQHLHEMTRTVLTKNPDIAETVLKPPMGRRTETQSSETSAAENRREK
jgi:hypothetical protein